MLTLFSVPKAFRGHISIIQTNAIQSWVRLYPRCEIILLGDDDGTAEIAARFGLRYSPDVSRNDYGTPLLNDLFDKAQAMASYKLMCYVNADIILMSDFMRSVELISRWSKPSLMVGKRWDVDIEQTLDFEHGDWEERLRSYVYERGKPSLPDWIDYFVFPRGLYTNVPPFAIGRLSFDNWLLWKARSSGAALVDASETVTAIHQNHDYSHHPQGHSGVWRGPEAKRNRDLMGGRRRYFTVADATHRLGSAGLKLNLHGEYFRQKWKFARRCLHDARHQVGLDRSNIERAARKVFGLPYEEKIK